MPYKLIILCLQVLRLLSNESFATYFALVLENIEFPRVEAISIAYWQGLIWALVELWQVEGQPDLPPWFTSRDKIFKIVRNLGQLVPTFC